MAIQQALNKKSLGIESQVLLLSYWETLQELTKVATTPDQLKHISWLGRLTQKIEVELRK